MAFPTLSLGLHILLILVGGPTLLCIGLIAFVFDMRKYGEEAFIFRKARKKNLPVLDVCDIGTGDSQMFLGVKDAKGDIYFDMKEYGDKLDPGMTTGDCAPSRYPHGLSIYHYSTISWLPLGPEQALGFKAINKTRTKYPNLKFLSDEEVHQLLDTPSQEMDHDVEMFIRKYRPQGGMIIGADSIPDLESDPKYRLIAWIPSEDIPKLLTISYNVALEQRLGKLIDKIHPTVKIDGEDLEIPVEMAVKKFQEFKKEVKEGNEEVSAEFKQKVLDDLDALVHEASATPIMDKKYVPFAYQAAHKDNPNSYSSQDMQHFEMNIWRKAAKYFEWAYQRMWMWIVAILAIIGIVGVLAIALLKFVD